MKLTIHKLTTEYLYMCVYIILYTFMIRSLYMGGDTVVGYIIQYTNPALLFLIFNIHHIYFTTVRLYFYTIHYNIAYYIGMYLIFIRKTTFSKVKF